MKNHTDQPIEAAILKTLEIYRKVIPYRNDLLFTKFLPQGYRDMTIASVDEKFYANVIIAKCHVGMLITLLDDFADHPQYFNSALLGEIYKIPFHSESVNLEVLNTHEKEVLNLVKYLFQNIDENIQILPRYEEFKAIYQFDMQRFYQSNRFAELMMQYNEMVNSNELLQLRPFNMGIVIVGTIDLMASPDFDIKELGVVRHILHLAQRFGSICNNLITFEREWAEGDITNEIIVKGLERLLISHSDRNQKLNSAIQEKLSHVIDELKIERLNIIEEAAKLSGRVKSIPSNKEMRGLKKLQALHESLQGVI